MAVHLVSPANVPLMAVRANYSAGLYLQGTRAMPATNFAAPIGVMLQTHLRIEMLPAPLPTCMTRGPMPATNPAGPFLASTP
eukprot:scaffold123017_cov22-Tisochrysis_lutea.AAC.2